MEEWPNLFNLNGDTTISKFKDETPDSIITESYHIRVKSYHYVLAKREPDSKTTNFRYKGVSKKGMDDMATDIYFPLLRGSLLDDFRSSISEQEARDLAIRTEVDPMTLVYRDCLFSKEIFYAKNVSIWSKDHILSVVESKKKALYLIDTKCWILLNEITTLPYGHWRNMIYKNMIKNGISYKEAEKRAIRAKLPEKYLNEHTFHIANAR